MEWIQQAEGVPIKSWCREVDPNALEQARNIAALPGTFHHVALMPDCHVGYGMPIGGVLACNDAVIPNAVGVDIGCGVHAARTDLPAEQMTTDSIKKVLGETRLAIPVGFKHHNHPQDWDGWESAPERSEPVRRELDSARRQLGTLGGGNHFLEIQAGDDGWTWLMLHSGSRNFGLKIAEHYHRLAQKRCEKQGIDLVSKDLAWLSGDTSEADEYLAAMEFALRFAHENRSLMMERFADIVSRVTSCRLTESVNIHHNYCHKEEHFGQTVYVHRKGATSAMKGQMGIIPGSMGTPSYIVRGRGNPESFMSCSHGAGRCMGRKQACRILGEKECDKAMEGVVHGRWRRTRKGDLDLSEAPQAYKNIEEVMEAQSDLVEIVTRLHPLGVIKG
ncbi:MAG: RtcB family protein [Lentisphaerae bacterium]|nr:RtcB family protein [Lentisphaerota bacterium]